MVEIVVDADACPVKDEVYAVAARYGIRTIVVANSLLRIPDGLGIEMIVVGKQLDAADDWIVENVRVSDLVITADVPLAARCIAVGARVLGTQGEPFTQDSIGAALATRNLKAELREAGIPTPGPRSISARERSQFSSRLDAMVRAAQREHG
ncbi:MAG: YaiI/YqxD family protein [Myxococcota bacterium]|nr:YaiI/YqxD family protein [Myxococcota bacterium]